MTAAPRFIAASRVMRGLVEQIDVFAATDANVLIAGETGSGKNAIAHQIHARGPRARLPFVTIDCAALAGSLIDAELFGHERGAYTDAVAARPGRFELAGAGTVYLDAVTELAPEAQGKLLRIVEEKRVERLGSHTSVAIGARIVSSVGQEIEEAVRAGRFRHDLYHRLRVLPLVVPPLRDRREDIVPLARHFLKQVAAARRRPPPAITRDAASALADYRWPGNVRELRHAVERAFAASEGRALTLDHLPVEILEPPAARTDVPPAPRPTLEDVERRYIAATLRHARGNQTEAARVLGISRKALWEKRKRYGLE